MSLLKDYIKGITQQAQAPSLFPETHITIAHATLKPQYEIYIRLYGFPENGVFNSSLLGSIINDYNIDTTNTYSQRTSTSHLNTQSYNLVVPTKTEDSTIHSVSYVNGQYVDNMTMKYVETVANDVTHNSNLMNFNNIYYDLASGTDISRNYYIDYSNSLIQTAKLPPVYQIYINKYGYPADGAWNQSMLSTILNDYHFPYFPISTESSVQINTTLYNASFGNLDVSNNTLIYIDFSLNTFIYSNLANISSKLLITDISNGSYISADFGGEPVIYINLNKNKLITTDLSNNAFVITNLTPDDPNNEIILFQYQLYINLYGYPITGVFNTNLLTQIMMQYNLSSDIFR